MERIDRVVGTFEKTDACPKTDLAGTPPAVLRRLPLYYRTLRALCAAGCKRTSSGELADTMGLTAPQVRRDLGCFGGFGQKGYGYNVPRLLDKIGQVLGVSDGYRAILIGRPPLPAPGGSLPFFDRCGVTLLAVFTTHGSPADATLPVLPPEEAPAFCRENGVQIAVFTGQAEGTSLPKALAAAGVRGILNMTERPLACPAGVTMEELHPADSLLNLCCRLRGGAKEPTAKEETT